MRWFPSDGARSEAQPSLRWKRSHILQSDADLEASDPRNATASRVAGEDLRVACKDRNQSRHEGRRAHMRRVILSMLLTGAIVAGPSLPAFGAVSTTQHLPAAACNQGTMTAHANIPETTGTGETTPGHFDVPGTANVTPCGHGG